MAVDDETVRLGASRGRIGPSHRPQRDYALDARRQACPGTTIRVEVIGKLRRAYGGEPKVGDFQP
jgi:hypothetical protein